MDGDHTPPKRFLTTRWTIVLQAGSAADEKAKQAALTELCRDYWYPVYAFVRRSVRKREDAEDITQGFFGDILRRDNLGSVDKMKGRFRSYLLGAVKNFIANQHRRSVTQKRGGGAAAISFDAEEVEQRYKLEPVDHETPELLYHRSWAETLIERVAADLGEEYRKAGKGALFDALRGRLAEPGDKQSHDAVAEELGMSSGAVAAALYRMRKRYAELLRRAVSDTLPGGESDMDVDEEIQELLRAVG